MITEGLRRAEIDHTPLNVLVIDEKTFLPLGRPWLTLIVDVAHRVILGYALSFEPPSYLSVMRCLKHAILPKTYLKDRYPDLENDWPCYGLMDSLGLDNGADFHSTGLYDMAARYGIDLDFCRVGEPWTKGIIERAQGTINRAVAHGQPGTLFEDLIERGDYKSASKACITLDEVHHLIHIWIVDYYHQKNHRGIGTAPIASWLKEMAHREIPLPTSSVELDQALAVRFTRTLSHKGIELDHLFYNSPDVLRVIAASAGRIEVEVARPADDVGYVYLNDPIAERFVKVPVIARYAEYANGLTPWQHAQCVRYSKKHHASRDDSVALATAKHRIRQGFLAAFQKVRGAAKRAAARFLKAASEASMAAKPDQPIRADQAPVTPLTPASTADGASPATQVAVQPRKLGVAASPRRAA